MPFGHAPTLGTLLRRFNHNSQAGQAKSFDMWRGQFRLRAVPDGVVAQLVEHHNGIVGVRGSNPLGSTILRPQRNPSNLVKFVSKSF
jgi:hypothetical protein